MAAMGIFAQAVDFNGVILSGAKLNVYDAGTSTPRAIYVDSGLATASANPAVATSAGGVAVWVDDTAGDIKIVLTNSAGTTTYYEQDNVDPTNGNVLVYPLGGTDQDLSTSSSVAFAGLTLSGNLDMQGNRIVLDADNDSYLNVNSDDSVSLFVGGVEVMKLDAASSDVLTLDGVSFSPTGATVGQALGYPNSATTLEPYTPAGGGDTLKAADEPITGDWDFQAGLNRSGQRLYDVDYYDSLAAALTAIDVLNARLYIGSPQTLTADTTIPSNVELCFGVRGRIITDTYTLTINGGISRSTNRTRIFNTSGGGSVTGSPVTDFVYPEWFNADGTKSGEWDEMQEALDFAALANAELLVAKAHTLDEDLTIASGQRIRGVTEVAGFYNTRLFLTGTAPTMKAFTAAASKGDTTVQLDTSGLSAGHYLRLASCINSGSTDAGDDRLFSSTSEESYFAEFVKIESITDGTQLELMSELIWDYSNTPGSDTADPLTDQSGGARSSVAWRVLFNSSTIIQDMIINTITPGAGDDALIIGEFCKDTIIDNCILNTGDVTGWAVSFTYSYGCLIRGCTIIGKQTNIDTGSTDNPVFFQASQNCFVDNCVIDGGNQGVDVITFGPDVGSGGHRGGPSIRCGARNVSCRNQQTDLATSHPGCYQSIFDGVQGTVNSNGIRIRSREDMVTNCVLSGGATVQGRGIFASGGYTIDAKISNNIVRGLQRGINIDPDDATAWTLPVNVDVTNNTVTRSRYGVYLESPNAATNQFFGARIFGNKVMDCIEDAIVVQDYFNGAHVTNNYIAGVGATYAAIKWEGNQSHLTVMDNFTEDVNASGYAREGNGAAAITDTGTFSGGEDDAYWFIGDHYGDGSDTGISHGTSAVRAASRTTESQTFGSVTATSLTAGSGTFGDGSSSVPVIADRSNSSGAVGYRFTNSQGDITFVGDPTGSGAGALYALFGSTVDFGTSSTPWKRVYSIAFHDQNGDKLLGDRVVDPDLDDAAAATAASFTDSTGGTASQTLSAVGDTSTTDQSSTINNNIASLSDDHNKLVTDVDDIRATVNALAAAFRAHGLGATS